MQTNAKKLPVKTHEGAVAKHINYEEQLKRSVLSCMLWEKEFYEDGADIADRIAVLSKHCTAKFVSDLAIYSREDMKLRHAPLWLCLSLARTGRLKADTLARVIQRPDELSELLSMYWSDGKCPISTQVKKGLARAFTKFDAYSLAKYNRDRAIKLRDVLFLCHAKPINDEQAATWKQLVDGTLPCPDTWESKMAGGKSKKDTFTDLLKDGKLGALALLRNLRNMREAGVDENLVIPAIENMNTTRVLPFRFIAAARHAPQWEQSIEKALYRCLSNTSTLMGKTVLLIDVSGSMHCPLSFKSDMLRLDAANGLAVCMREICSDIEIYTFSNNVVRVPSRHGFSLRDAVQSSQHHGCTYLGKAVKAIDKSVNYDRLIVITDEQSHDPVPDPKGNGYMVNIASAKNGVGYNKWTHVNGFSESVIRWICENEKYKEF